MTRDEALEAAARLRPDVDPETFIAAEDARGWSVTFHGPGGRGFLTPVQLEAARLTPEERILATMNDALPVNMRDSPMVQALAEQMGGELERLRALGRMPYPPVFRHWNPEHRDARRVATVLGPAGPGIEFMHDALPSLRGEPVWALVELTEEDTCLLAASLLQRAERGDLAELVLRGLAEEPPE